MLDLNRTHDPSHASWLASARVDGGDFPLQNLPFGMFVVANERRPGVAIGDSIVDLRACLNAGLLQGDAAGPVGAVSGEGLNLLMASDPMAVSRLRARLWDLLRIGGDPALRERAEGLLRLQSTTEMALPCTIGDYTDFLTSLSHTERHGRYKGLADPVPPQFHSLPVAYHGRASSIRVSGTGVVRPHGQWRDETGAIQFGPARALDFELELAAIIGAGNALSRPVQLDAAPEHIFGYALLNDWSAKSIQWWEQMLGPFLGKSFMTTLGAWVVTREALAPFACTAPYRRESDLLPYLFSRQDRARGGLSISLEASIRTERMREAGASDVRLTSTRLGHLHWTFAQMLTHHTSNGCDLRTGDLLGSGTISGEADDARACLTEITNGGRTPVSLSSDESRLWLEDGDEITLRARAHADGAVSIGFGPCTGRVLPAIEWPGVGSKE